MLKKGVKRSSAEVKRQIVKRLIYLSTIYFVTDSNEKMSFNNHWWSVVKARQYTHPPAVYNNMNCHPVTNRLVEFMTMNMKSRNICIQRQITKIREAAIKALEQPTYTVVCLRDCRTVSTIQKETCANGVHLVTMVTHHLALNLTARDACVRLAHLAISKYFCW